MCAGCPARFQTKDEANSAMKASKSTRMFAPMIFHRSTKLVKTKWPLRQICHNGQRKASSSKLANYERLHHFVYVIVRIDPIILACSKPYCTLFVKMRSPVRIRASAPENQSEMTGFLLFCGKFSQKKRRGLAFHRPSLPFSPDLSHFVSRTGYFLSFSFQCKSVKMEYHKSYHIECTH